MNYNTTRINLRYVYDILIKKIYFNFRKLTKVQCVPILEIIFNQYYLFLKISIKFRQKSDNVMMFKNVFLLVYFDGWSTSHHQKVLDIMLV